MEHENTTNVLGQQEAKSKASDLRTFCLLCWKQIDLDLDRRGKPYSFCPRCGIRIFMSRTTVDDLKSRGLAWSGEPPLETLRRWFRNIAVVIGLKKDGHGRAR
jgi:DNA-directed RNA polymerase subunit RPC12/RpoP